MMIKTFLALLGTLVVLPGEISLTGDGNRRALESHSSSSRYGEAAPIFILSQNDRNFWSW